MKHNDPFTFRLPESDTITEKYGDLPEGTRIKPVYDQAEQRRRNLYRKESKCKRMGFTLQFRSIAAYLVVLVATYAGLIGETTAATLSVVVVGVFLVAAPLTVLGPKYYAWRSDGIPPTTSYYLEHPDGTSESIPPEDAYALGARMPPGVRVVCDHNPFEETMEDSDE